MVTGKVAFSGDELRRLHDGKMVAYLFSAYQELRTAQPPMKFDPTFISELLMPRFLRSCISDVPQLTACILCDVLRLTPAERTGSGMATLPFSTSKCSEVLSCIVTPFQESIGMENCMKRCEHIIERAGACRVMVSLLPYCNPDQVTDMVSPLFAAVQTSGLKSKDADNDGAASTSTAASLAQILADIILTTNMITSEQLSVLLSAQVSGSAALKSGKLIASLLSSPSLGYHVASRVLLMCLDTVHGTIYDMVTDNISAAVSSMSGDGENEERTQCFVLVSRQLEIAIALTELHLGMVQSLIPYLTPFLNTENADLRLLFVRSFAAIFTCRSDAVPSFRASFEVFCSRANDVRPQIRAEVLTLVLELVRCYVLPERWAAGAKPIPCNAFKEVWPTLFGLVIERLVDTQPMVRRQAIHTLADAITCAPELLTNVNLKESLGCRTADKHPKVREAALMALSGIYQKYDQLSVHIHLDWIPSCVLEASQAEDGGTMVEMVFSQLLSIPVKSEKRLTSDAYAKIWHRLCNHLSCIAWMELLRIARRKVRIRGAVSRLYQLRQQVIESGEQMSEEGGASPKANAIHDMHRLLQFLEASTGSEKGEWNTLFRCKDVKVAAAVLQCCSETNEDWESALQAMQQSVKGRIDEDAYTFVSHRLTVMLAFAIPNSSLQHLQKRLLSGVETGTVRALQVFIATSPCFVSQSLEAILRAFSSLCDNNRRTRDQVLGVLELMAESFTAASQLRSRLKNFQIQGLSQTQCQTVLRKLADWSSGTLMCDRESAAAVSKKASQCLAQLSDVCELYIPSMAEAGKKVIGDVTTSAMKGFEREVKRIYKEKQLSSLQDASKTIAWLSALRVLPASDATYWYRMDHLRAYLSSLVTHSSASVKNKSSSGSNAIASIDATCKCVSATALCIRDPKKKMGLVGTGVAALLDAVKLSKAQKSLDPAVRMPILQQLTKLACFPSANMEAEISVAVALSSEDNQGVRSRIVEKMTHRICRSSSPCDMRYVSFLLLSAMYAAGKNEFQELRQAAMKIGDVLRRRQSVNGGVSLSSPGALQCYMEYTIPFLVFLMAHHPLYEEQEAIDFVGFQRVWHLVLEELLRGGGHCVEFVSELIKTVKQSSDKFAPSSSRLRALCEVGLVIFQHHLSSRNLSLDPSRKYPGSILLPSFFTVASGDASVDQGSALRNDIRIPSHVPFRMSAADPATSVPATPTVSPRLSMEREPVSSTRTSGAGKRPRQRPSAEESPKQRRTEPTEVFLAEESAGKTPREVAVSKMVKKLTEGLNKQQIAELRWKEVKSRVEKIHSSAVDKGEAGGEKVETLVEFAKGQLRKRLAAAS